MINYDLISMELTSLFGGEGRALRFDLACETLYLMKGSQVEITVILESLTVRHRLLRGQSLQFSYSIHVLMNLFDSTHFFGFIDDFSFLQVALDLFLSNIVHELPENKFMLSFSEFGYGLLKLYLLMILNIFYIEEVTQVRPIELLAFLVIFESYFDVFEHLDAQTVVIQLQFTNKFVSKNSLFQNSCTLISDEIVVEVYLFDVLQLEDDILRLDYVTINYIAALEIDFLQ